MRQDKSKFISAKDLGKLNLSVGGGGDGQNRALK